MPTEREERENEYMAKKKKPKKVTRHLEISEGFPEKQAMCDPGLEGQEGCCELTAYNTALVPGTCPRAVPILTHLTLKTTYHAGTIAIPFYR